jgi:hypothetical protein
VADENRKGYNFRFQPSLIDRIDRVVERTGEKRTAFVEQAILDKLAAHEVMGRFVCPFGDYFSDSPNAICAAHGRKVVPVE